MNNNYKDDFPLLKKSPRVYFDNAATTQRPDCVIQAEKYFYENLNANPFRGLYELSVKATDAYENSRQTVQKFINAKSEKEIIFTRNTTESINLIAYSFGLFNIKKDDEIVVTIMEHHSNLLPWQMVARQTGAVLKFLECQTDGTFLEEDIKNTITDKTKILAITHVSNVLGRINPIEKIIQIAHSHKAIVIIDAAQSAPHVQLDVQKLDADFLTFSGHKLFAPMGIGVLYGKENLLEQMNPFMYGGEMIESVTRNNARYAELPHKFEAGTVNVAGAYGLKTAIEYIQKIGLSTMNEIETSLTKYLIDGLLTIPHVKILGSSDYKEHVGIVTFTIDQVHPHDISSILDSDGIDVRAGHHCAQPLLDFLGTKSTTRASLMFYNTIEEIDYFLQSISQIRKRIGYGN